MRTLTETLESTKPASVSITLIFLSFINIQFCVCFPLSENQTQCSSNSGLLFSFNFHAKLWGRYSHVISLKLLIKLQ